VCPVQITGHLNDYLTDKHLALVGNGSVHPSFTPDFINAADGVICFNGGATRADRTWRCDVLICYPRVAAGEGLSSVAFTVDCRIGLFPAALVQAALGKIFRELTAVLGRKPTTGLVMIELALRSGVKALTLPGFLLNPSIKESLPLDKRKAADCRHHNWVGERRFLAKRVQEARAQGVQITLEPKLEEVLDLPAPRFAGANAPRKQSLVVLMTTKNRAGLLQKRSLPSVFAQTRKPDEVVIVDDSDAEHGTATEAVVREFQGESWCQVTLLRNQRTPGLSGATNTGLAYLAEKYPPEATLVATLDDDDEWFEEYLAKNWEAFAQGADIIASGVMRRESVTVVKPLTIPAKVDARQFLVGNPHIQGSNKAVRLSTWLMAGMMDERLPACTDRDAGYRLFSLAGVRYMAIRQFLVHHYAENNRPRLTKVGSPEHRKGLRAFYAKYRMEMSLEQRAEARARHRKFHAVDIDRLVALADIQVSEAAGKQSPPESSITVVDDARPVTLDVGVTVLPEEDAWRLFWSLRLLRQISRIDRIRLVVLCAPDNLRMNRQLVRLERRGIEIHRRDLERGPKEFPHRTIAANRHRVRQELYRLPGLGADITWLADGDYTLRPLGARGAEKWVRALRQLRAQGFDGVMGCILGEPPIPEVSTLRGQFYDLSHTLSALAYARPEAMYEAIAREYPCGSDDYYDYSPSALASKDHGFPYIPTRSGMTNREVFVEICKKLPNLLHGKLLTRKPIVADAETWSIAHAISASEAHCGGNLFIFNRELLAIAVSPPVIYGRTTRRGDSMSVALAMHCSLKIARASLPIWQHRPATGKPSLSLEKLADDILGHVAFRVLVEAMGNAAGMNRQSMIEYVREVGRATLAARLGQIRLSLHEVVGLAQGLERLLSLEAKLKGQRRRPWWLYDAEMASSLRLLGEFLTQMQMAVSLEKIRELDEYLSAADLSPLGLWVEETLHGGVVAA